MERTKGEKKDSEIVIKIVDESNRCIGTNSKNLSKKNPNHYYHYFLEATTTSIDIDIDIPLVSSSLCFGSLGSLHLIMNNEDCFLSELSRLSEIDIRDHLGRHSFANTKP